MGAEPWMYFVPYQQDIAKALNELRVREFSAGRYFPAMDNIWMLLPVGPKSPSPGAKHPSIEAALHASGDSGTRSILDMICVSETPEDLAVSPVDPDMLEELFGTTQPTRAMVESNQEFFEDIDRGRGIYMLIYQGGFPQEILFAGYSFD